MRDETRLVVSSGSTETIPIDSRVPLRTWRKTLTIRLSNQIILQVKEMKASSQVSRTGRRRQPPPKILRQR